MPDLTSRETWTAASRHLLLAPLFFLPRHRRIAAERYLRGRQEYARLQQADWALVSWGKSGRTWFRVMLSRFYQLHFGLDTDYMLEFDNFHRLNPQAPKVLFSHNNYIRDYTGHRDSLDHYKGRRLVLMVRDPRDVAVSQYFQWRYRMLPRKKALNAYPPHGAEVDVFDFVCNPDCGIPRIVEAFNTWARAIPALGEDVLLVRYEDLRADPAAVLERVVSFTGLDPRPEHIEAARDYADYENMKKREASKEGMRGSGQRVKPGDEGNPDSFKVRRGKVGGYRDYFTPEQVQTVDAMVDGVLDPSFGYSAP
ncbi:sulfotransferase domain-containing protein [Roseovarius ramblicola]|uniref:Sulfotransferase domain-containing protein n=1 Tax=Roseovarius ramblicola TaxID=2022336 RepID=A0ABV5I0R7_9RHOB